ncbi:MAG TPA: methyltransferase [Mycetocola sp.]|jgi:16S rRNA (guanine1207-N2)-methyltransferase|uniref:class I SAM-dependent methyltransferase n=1 Tax=Mycetocola sp. TaxID=1871042 RepID=UPI002626B885|nr:methyltransferase [Mycetocola sp.]MCU1559489.1 rRNA m(2)G methyltransferase [Mycetocola sp.]HEV7848708.1 methyltransferase [Mycetocola sp.]
MASDHYFTGVPGTELKLRTVTVHLAGAERELTTANGIFSPGRIDQGTQVLLSETPRPPATGNILDLGCGWGPIAFTIAFASPDATVWAVDVNERSLELVRLNAEKLGLSNVRAVLPDQVPADLAFDSIWSNPPIRIGKQALHDMLELWLPRLAPGSDAWLVVQKNLGADSLHRWLQERLSDDFDVTREAISKGYRVLRAARHDG